MGEMKKLDKDLCKTCKYKTRMSGSRMYGGDGSTQTCCDYMDMAGHSRYLKDGKKTYDAKIYCDKYEDQDGAKPRKKISFTPKGRKLNEKKREHALDQKRHRCDGCQYNGQILCERPKGQACIRDVKE